MPFVMCAWACARTPVRVCVHVCVPEWSGLPGTTRGTNPRPRFEKAHPFLLSTHPFIHRTPNAGLNSTGSAKEEAAPCRTQRTRL